MILFILYFPIYLSIYFPIYLYIKKCIRNSLTRTITNLKMRLRMKDYPRSTFINNMLDKVCYSLLHRDNMVFTARVFAQEYKSEVDLQKALKGMHNIFNTVFTYNSPQGEKPVSLEIVETYYKTKGKMLLLEVFIENKMIEQIHKGVIPITIYDVDKTIRYLEYAINRIHPHLNWLSSDGHNSLEIITSFLRRVISEFVL